MINELFSSLNARLGQCDFLQKEKNQALLALDSPEQLAAVIGQYSRFPARIVGMLRLGVARTDAWQAVKTELKENVIDESGGRTGGIPHYVILCREVEKAFGLKLVGIRASLETEDFLSGVESELLDASTAKAAGMMYALEASAVPELEVVATLINRYAASVGKPQAIDFSKFGAEPVVNSAELSLTQFFGLHIGVFEIDHRDHLADAVRKHIASAYEIEEFQKGFEVVIEAMDTWWKALACL